MSAETAKAAVNSSRSWWRRLKRNRGAMIGMVVIALAVLTAVFAYWLAPDASPYANQMTVEIGGKKPGFSMLFLKIPKDTKVPEAGFWRRAIGGQAEPFLLLPIFSYEIQHDRVKVKRYVDENTSAEESYPVSLWKDPDPKEWVLKRTFRLGTDKFGRDILSRLLVGVRVSLSVGLITVLISLTIGVLLGAFAGYYRGKVDAIIMWFINVIWSIPTLLLVFAITLLLGKGFWQVFIAMGLTMWVNVARIVRGQILGVRELEYVEAARALGYSSFRILFLHILPNIMGPLLVVAASNFASSIVIEAGLSFLGIGVQPPQPSWGLMINENYNFIITHNPMIALAPGFAIMILVLAFNLLGNGLRDAMAVK